MRLILPWGKKIAGLGILMACAFRLGAAEGEWGTDLHQALAKAKADHKFVLVEFGGSDWCPPCKRLKAEIFSRKEFIEFARDNLILVDIDFPQSTPQSKELQKTNAKLAEKYEIEIFPTVLVLNAKGKKIHKDVGFPGTSFDQYLEQLKKEIKR